MCILLKTKDPVMQWQLLYIFYTVRLNGSVKLSLPRILSLVLAVAGHWQHRGLTFSFLPFLRNAGGCHCLLVLALAHAVLRDNEDT